MSDFLKIETIADLELYIRESKKIAIGLSRDCNEYDSVEFRELYITILDLFEEVFCLISRVCADVDAENYMDLALQVFQTSGVYSIQKTLFEKSQKSDLIIIVHVLLNFFVNSLVANGRNRYGIEWPRDGYFITSHYIMDRTSDDVISFEDMMENLSREKMIEPNASIIAFLIKPKIIEMVEDSY